MKNEEFSVFFQNFKMLFAFQPDNFQGLHRKKKLKKCIIF